MSPTFAPATSIVPDESLIAPLRSRHAASGFRGVYQKGCTRDGHPIYVAKFKYGGSFKPLRGGGLPIPNSHSTQPHVCAVFVAKKYIEVFGERWREVLEARKVNTWHVGYSNKWQGYIASVWVKGKREEVVSLRRRTHHGRQRRRPSTGERWARTDRRAVWATVDDAKQGAQLYLARLYGEDWRFLLYRQKSANLFTSPSL